MEDSKIDGIIKKISVIRNKKGYTFENMAMGLGITPAAYRKIETGETKLTVDRMFKISEILKTSVAELLELGHDFFQQNNSDQASGCCQQKIENFHQESCEVYERLLAAKDEQIALLKEMMSK